MPPAEKKDLSPTAASSVAPMVTTGVETVIIFDWDDTLLASSFLSGLGYRLDNNPERSPELTMQLKELEQSVCSVLNLAIGFGPVHIVTNAESGWVQMSAQKFIPGVVPLLSKVKVVSARSTYETMFPDSPLKWKFYAFQEKISQSFAEMKTDKNVISFGDSYVEREAVRAVTKGLPNTRTKSVKFAERPSMEQLRRQIELVSNCFQYIYNHDGDLDLQLTVTVNSPPNSQPSSPTAAPTAAAATVVPPSPKVTSAQPSAQSMPASLLNRVTPPTTPTHGPAGAAALVHPPRVSSPPTPVNVSAPSTPKVIPKSPIQSVVVPRTATQSVSNLIFGGTSPAKPSAIMLPPASPLKQTTPLFPSSAGSHLNHAMAVAPMPSLSLATTAPMVRS